MSADSIDPAPLDDLWDELWLIRADPAVVVNLLEVTDHPTWSHGHLFEVTRWSGDYGSPVGMRGWLSFGTIRVCPTTRTRTPDAGKLPPPAPVRGRWLSAISG